MRQQNSSHPGTRLKELIHDPAILVMPGAYDALSARVVETSGFGAIQISGYGVSVSRLGLTDASFTNLSDVAEVTRQICDVVKIPVMTDADTGYGNAVNTAWTIERLGGAGAAGANLEDQVFPKICGLQADKNLISLSEMVGKVKAAADHRVHPDFVINARTDALGSTGERDAIDRANAYRQAGADMIYVSSPPSDPDLIARLVNRIDAPVAVNLPEGGSGPDLRIQDLEDLGVARVSVPLTTMFAAARAMQNALDHLSVHGTSQTMDDAQIMSFDELSELSGSSAINEIEHRYSAASLST